MKGKQTSAPPTIPATVFPPQQPDCGGGCNSVQVQGLRPLAVATISKLGKLEAQAMRKSGAVPLAKQDGFH